MVYQSVPSSTKLHQSMHLRCLISTLYLVWWCTRVYYPASIPLHIVTTSAWFKCNHCKMNFQIRHNNCTWRITWCTRARFESPNNLFIFPLSRCWPGMQAINNTPSDEGCLMNSKAEYQQGEEARVVVVRGLTEWLVGIKLAARRCHPGAEPGRENILWNEQRWWLIRLSRYG